MNNSKQVLAVARNFQRYFIKNASTSSSSEAVASKIKKLREAQQKFQIEDGVPVYIKGGFGDRALYQLTLGLTAVGLGMSVEVFYRLIFGKAA